MTKKVLFTAGFFALAFVACKKPITIPNSGIYRGTFFQTFDNGDTNAQGVANLSLAGDESGGTFSMSGDTATGAPISCNGDYVINNSTVMTFTNTANVGNLGYQPHYILNAAYAYTFDNNAFTLEMSHDTTNYQYNLIRN